MIVTEAQLRYRIACEASLKTYEADIAPAKASLMASYDDAIVVFQAATAPALEAHMARMMAASDDNQHG